MEPQRATRRIAVSPGDKLHRCGVWMRGHFRDTLSTVTNLWIVRWLWIPIGWRVWSAIKPASRVPSEFCLSPSFFRRDFLSLHSGMLQTSGLEKEWVYLLMSAKCPKKKWSNSCLRRWNWQRFGIIAYKMTKRLWKLMQVDVFCCWLTSGFSCITLAKMSGSHCF